MKVKFKYKSPTDIEDIYNIHPYLKDRIKNQFSILDLGFGDPGNLIYLNYSIPITEYIGIDQMDSNSFSLNIQIPDSIPLPIDLVDCGPEDKIPFNKYVKFHKYHGTGRIISRNKFDKVYKFHFETDALEYINQLNNTKYFSLIIISNLLHLLDKKIADELFENSFNHLKDGGLMYIKLYIEDSSRKFYKHIRPYNNLEIKMLKDKFNIIHFESLNSEGQKIIIGEK